MQIAIYSLELFVTKRICGFQEAVLMYEITKINGFAVATFDP
jgi:hypothetical protein